MTDVTYELDLSAHAGILLGAFMTGRSFQPNLLSRATKDQAILSGVAAATGYGWGTSAHSLLRPWPGGSAGPVRAPASPSTG